MDKIPEHPGNKKRKHHKNRDREKNRNHHHARHQDFLQLFAEPVDQKFLKLSRLLFLFVALYESGRPGERLHPQDHGIGEIKDSPYKRERKQLYLFRHAYVGILHDSDLPVGLSDRHGITVLVLHHDTL